MKKLLFVLILAAVGYFYFYEKVYKAQDSTQNTDPQKSSIANREEVVVIPPKIVFDNSPRSFNHSSLQFSCKDDSAICAVDLAVKCTIDPYLEFCDPKKLPRFIFMEEEALGRPSNIEYKVVRTIPIDMNTVEVQTKSQCDGMWFGLCEGNIIYVVNNSSGEWRVKEIYALESY